MKAHRPRGRTELPLISVVTPSFNQGRFIGETIGSVLAQEYPKIEHIIVDGCSTDGTIEILRSFADQISWISEPDRGQADAVNKGFSMARGEILGWLNSDDTYNHGALRMVAERFASDHEAVMLYGDAYFIDEAGCRVREYPTERFRLGRLLHTCYICQPTVFMRAEIFREIGPLDISLQTCMDYDYWIRVAKRYPPQKVIYLRGTFLANSRIYADNKTFGMRRKVYSECMRTQRRHFGRVSYRWILSYIKEMYLGFSARP